MDSVSYTHLDVYKRQNQELAKNYKHGLLLFTGAIDQTVNPANTLRPVSYTHLAIFAGVVSGCLDDDNNYNYKQINWLQGGDFNFENINSEYNLIEGD